jgi:uncharacterized protein (TIRG00374 family)
LEIPDVDIKKQLNWKRILIPVLLGVFASGFLLVRSLNEVKFVKAPQENKGEYSWIDSNENGAIDHGDSEEFVATVGGDYVMKSFRNMLTDQRWTMYSFLALLGALLTVVIRDLGYMYRIRALTDNAISWRKSFDVIMLWEFASALTPSVVGGSGVAIFILNREGINLGKSTATVFVTALMDELFYIITVPLVILLVGSAHVFPETWIGGTGLFGSVKPLFYAGYGFIVLLTSIIFLSIFFFPYSFKRLLMRLFTIRLLRRWLRKATEVGDEIVASSEELKGKSMGYWIRPFAATMLSWTARFFTLNFIFLAFISSFDHFVVYARQLVMWVIMLISPTPGSSGVAELALDSFFRDIIPSSIVLLLITLLWRLLTYFPYLFVGIAVLPGWIRRTSQN